MIIRLLFLLNIFAIVEPADSLAQALTENIQFNLATVLTPSSGTNNLTIGASGGVSGTATVISGSPAPAQYLVTKGQGANGSISIDVQAVDSIAGITLDNFTAIYDGSTITLPATGQPAPGAQGKTLIVGGRATISSTLTEGSHLPDFDIIIVKE